MYRLKLQKTLNESSFSFQNAANAVAGASEAFKQLSKSLNKSKCFTNMERGKKNF